MQIYNTLSRQKEDLVPLDGNEFKMYVCGPTVYNYFHIGNARPFLLFDVLRRYLEYRGYTVNFVQNFTDIDDKLIHRAITENTTVDEIATRYIEEYWTDAKGLNIRPATTHPRATENIDGILEIINTLVAKGHAYATGDGDVYFSTRSFAEYGKLSHQPLEDLEAGARISVGESKRDPMDFALWKAAKPGEPMWDSPYGKGRPGWHIECSAMSRRYLGETIDIHCGGQDLVFPHHENEIAQSECCWEKPFVRYWMHNAYINIDSHKMSKSLNNFFTVRDVAEVYGYEPLRFFLLSAHYRSPVNYSTDVLDSCKVSLERIYTCRDNLDFAIENAPETGVDTLSALCDERTAQFIEAMDDDLNTADALAAVFELVRDINSAQEQPKSALQCAAKTMDELCDVIGLLYNRKTSVIPADILALAQRRQDARAAKDFALADQLRGEITAQGYLLEDTAQGPKISKK